MQKLIDYVLKHTVRGECQCGRCIAEPEKFQGVLSTDHTVNLTFFKVTCTQDSKREDFLALVKEEYPVLLDGAEHSYMQVGAEMGDQGIALCLIGLGNLLNVWLALTPDTLMPFLPEETKMQMAGCGMVSLMFKERKPRKVEYEHKG